MSFPFAARTCRIRLGLQSRSFLTADPKKGNAFVNERQAIQEHAAHSSELWKRLSWIIIPPAIAVAGWNAHRLYNEHWEHWSHLPPLEERVQYSYQNLRGKKYQWGDGDKTLFWNDSVNYNKKD